MTQEMLCPDCGAQIPQEAFDGRPEYGCANCGARLDMVTPETGSSQEPPNPPAPEPQSRQSKRTTKCPECGEPVSRNDQYCPSCDYRLDDDDGYRSDGPGYPFQIGDVINQTWELFQENGGIVVGVTLLNMFITFLVTIPEAICRNIAERNHDEVFLLVGFGFQFIRFLFTVWISVGFTRFMLNVVKGRRAEVTDLFSGTDLYGGALLNTFVFIVAIMIGFMACIVPGIILALAMGQFLYILVELPESSGLEPLSRSWRLTEGSRANLFLLGLVAFGINIAGICALCVGFLVSAPFTSLMFAVAYYHMTGRDVKVRSRSRRQYDDAYDDEDNKDTTVN
ncbi:MAG: zinc ribbon domain-containing protein [Planctomycetaceae bacterium]